MGRNMEIGKEFRKTTVAGHTEGKKQSKHLARISWENLLILFARKHRSSILHEYLDYKNL